jgi:hypothetical protein
MFTTLTRKTILSMTVAAGVAAAPVLAFGQANTGGSSAQPQTTQTTPQQGSVSGTPGARSSGAGASGTATSQGTTIPGPTTAQSGNTSSPRDGTPGNPPSTATQRATDSVTGERTPPDATPGNPPGTAAGRAMDSALGTNTTGANPAANDTASTGATPPGSMAVDSVRLRDGRRASKVIGSTVYGGGDGNDSIGSIDDLIVLRDGDDPIAILSVGGFLGIGAKLVALPYERLQHNAERNRWVLPGATKESLTALPSFAYDAEPRGGGTATGSDRPAGRGSTTGGGSGAQVPPTPPATRN